MIPDPRFLLAIVVAAGLFPSTASAQSDPGEVISFTKLDDGIGGIPAGTLGADDLFGAAVTTLGDLDGDGIEDAMAGAVNDSTVAPSAGAVYTLFLEADGSVRDLVKITTGMGGFTGALHDDDEFGRSLTSMGDLDADGVVDVAVGAYGDDDGSPLGNNGAVWILFMNSDGTVKSHRKINEFDLGGSGVLDNGDRFGGSVADLGDLDGDGVLDIAVGADGDDDGGNWRGAVYILFLRTDGSVKAVQKISATQGGFTGVLDERDLFGESSDAPGDIDGDGVIDLCVGAREDDDGGFDRGAVWVLFLNTDGTVKAHQKISQAEGGFAALLADMSLFGRSVAGLGDIDRNGVLDLAVGANDDDGGIAHGAVWVLFMEADGSTSSQLKISDSNGLGGSLLDYDQFGSGLSTRGDEDDDGTLLLVVGGNGGVSGTAQGSVWAVVLDADSAWMDLGFGLEGTNGFPMLIGTGSLVGGTLTELNLTGARPFATAYLLVGFSSLFLPFKGGVLGPAPDGVFPFTVNGLGEIPFPFIWPTGLPSGAIIYWQYWIEDAAGRMGFAASNVLKATTP